MAGKKGRSGRKPLPLDRIKPVHLGLNVPPSLYSKIEKAARGDGRSIAGWMRRLFETTLEPKKTSEIKPRWENEREGTQ